MPYITPLNISTTVFCGRLFIPNDIYILAAVRGALDVLSDPSQWEQVTGVSTDAIADAMQQMSSELWIGQYCMIGALIHYVTDTPPHSILKCDGTQYLRVDYPRLYSELPAGLIVDSDNFIVPTIEDVFMLATGGTHAQGDTGGQEAHTLTTDEMPAHDHLYDKPTFNIDTEAPGVPDPSGVGEPAIPTLTSSSGGGQPHENMPPFSAYHVGIVAR